MVHVPFFGIDLPEPRLGALLPGAVDLLVRGTHQALEHGRDLIWRPTEGELRKLNAEFEASIPREFDRVRRRYAEGKIMNDEQLSSELEDASFDWYRRQLRTSVLGATDEDLEDVAARNLNLRPPKAQSEALDAALADAIASAGAVDVEAERRAAAALAAAHEEVAEQQRQVQARVQRVEQLRRDVRPTRRQALDALTNASGGVVLGVLLVKSAALAGRRLFRRGRKPQQRPQQLDRRGSAQAQALPVQPSPRGPHAAAVAAAAPAARQQGGAAAQQQRPTAAEDKSKAAAGAAGTTRKTRAPAKKR